MRRDAEINAEIGRTLRARRRALRLSLRTVGDAIGVTSVQLHKYERGLAGVSAERLWRLAVALRCSPGDLLCEPDPYEHPGALRLVDAWSRLRAPGQRQAVLGLLEALSAQGLGEPLRTPASGDGSAAQAPSLHR